MLSATPMLASGTAGDRERKSFRSGETSIQEVLVSSKELLPRGSVTAAGITLACLCRASAGLHPVLQHLHDAWSKHIGTRVATAISESRAQHAAPVDLGASVLYTEEELSAAVLWVAQHWTRGTQAAAKGIHTADALAAAVGAPVFDLSAVASAAHCPDDGCLLAPLHVPFADLTQLRGTWRSLHPAGKAAYHLGVHDCLLAPSRVAPDSAARPRLWPGPAFWPAPKAEKNTKGTARTRMSSDTGHMSAASAEGGLSPWGAAALPPSVVDAALAALAAGVLVVGAEPAPRAIIAAAHSLDLQNGASYAVLLAEALAAQQLEASGGRGTAALRQLCMQGCPAAARKDMWGALLECPTGVEAEEWMQVLLSAAAAGQCPLAPLFAGDAEATGDDEAFFPFEGSLAQLAAALCHDASIAQQCAVQPHLWVADTAQGGALLPPSGVLPYEQLSSLAAPLTLVCPEDTTSMYFIWQRMVSVLLADAHPSSHAIPR